MGNPELQVFPSHIPTSSAPLGTPPPGPLRPPLQSLQCGEDPGSMPLQPMARGLSGMGAGAEPALQGLEKHVHSALGRPDTPAPLSARNSLLEACITARHPCDSHTLSVCSKLRFLPKPAPPFPGDTCPIIAGIGAWSSCPSTDLSHHILS